MTGQLDYPKPCCCGLRKTAVEKVAENAARTLGYRPAGDVVAAVQKLGGTVEFLSLDDWLAHQHDTITVNGPQDFTIRLMRSDGPLRHRFTIAHELGHYILHSGQGQRRLKAGRDGSDCREEWEANWFAAAFLMPEADFRAAAEANHGDANRLAGRFLVSAEAARVRLKSLGLAMA